MPEMSQISDECSVIYAKWRVCLAAHGEDGEEHKLEVYGLFEHKTFFPLVYTRNGGQLSV